MAHGANGRVLAQRLNLLGGRRGPALVRRGSEPRRPVAAVELRGIEGHVRLVQQVARGDRVVGAGGHADRDRHRIEQLLVSGGRHARAQALGYDEGALVRRLRQEHGELLASVASHGVDPAHLVGEDAGDLL